jgi:hypothetical protein
MCKRPPGSVECRTNRTDGHTQDVSDLFVGKTLHFAENDGETLLLRKTPDCTIDCIGGLPPTERLWRRCQLRHTLIVIR